MMKKYIVFLLLVGLVACQTAAPAPTPTAAPSSSIPPYQNPALPTAERVDDLLSRMTLAEKLGQMTLVEKGSITPADISTLGLGGLLSGGGGSPAQNTAEAWLAMVNGFQEEALQSRLGIPLIYGVDAVHGHGNLRGATIFPHNIGLGAANNPTLMEAIGRATAVETAATGIRWNYGPAVSIARDPRWGRTYESYSEDPERVATLASAYVRGLQGADLSAADSVLATPKHFVGDGGTAWGSSHGGYQIDQGDTQVDEATLRAIHLVPYPRVIAEGAQSIMVSFSRWNNAYMHGNQYLLTDVLRDEFGFSGFIVSDWQAINQINPDFYAAVVQSINAGVDMNMVPYDYKGFITVMETAVANGDISMERVDAAVRHILTVKFNLGLFERPLGDDALLSQVGSAEHRALAREAVQQSLVLLQNNGGVLPLAADTPTIFVAGAGADDIGLQSGGWTIQWQGQTGNITPGTTILDGIEAQVSAETTVHYNALGNFERVTDDSGQPLIADVGIAVLSEQPYAEGVGDSATLTLSENETAVLARLQSQSKVVIVVLLSGRPLIINDLLEQSDAFVAAWLPGTEGNGVADVLFGDVPFTGTLPSTWPRAVPTGAADFATLPAEMILFPRGFSAK